VPGKKNVLPDVLSRYPKPEAWEAPSEDEDDLEPFIDRTLSKHDEVFSVEEEDRGSCSVEEYTEESQDIARFILYLQRPEELRGKEWRRWAKHAAQFFVRERHLFKKATKVMPARRVIDRPETQAALIREVHEQLGHKGVQGTYSAINDRYWWPEMYQQVTRMLGPCLECQSRKGSRRKAELGTTISQALWAWWTIHITHMPTSQGKSYLVVAREYLSGWPEARALRVADSDAVAKLSMRRSAERFRWMEDLRTNQ
jgi:hypothetical protein